MPRLAAVDCGTNSIRLLVADVGDDGKILDVHREMRIVRLGQGVDATGRLAPEALRRTRDALTDYAATIARTGATATRMVATSATRDAANRDEFFAMTREVLGVPAEVITGDEEAALSFAGAVADLDPAHGPFVVTDVGGGSTEVVLGDWDGRTATVRAARSVDVGCVRLTERCLHDDPPTADQVAEAVAVVDAALADAFDAVDVRGAGTWVGVAGTVTTVVALALGLTEYDAERIHRSTVRAEDVERTTGWLIASGNGQRAALPVIHPGRRDVLCGGAIVVRELSRMLARRAGITDLLASEHDILDGIVLALQ